MAQDGKVREQEIADGTRKVFYVDVGDMEPKEALRVLNDIRKNQGMAPVTRSWHNWVFIIAAIVKANDGVLVTNNIREFERVKGLKVENWVR